MSGIIMEGWLKGWRVKPPANEKSPAVVAISLEVPLDSRIITTLGKITGTGEAVEVAISPVQLPLELRNTDRDKRQRDLDDTRVRIAGATPDGSALEVETTLGGLTEAADRLAAGGGDG